MNLFINYYSDPDEKRYQELETCLLNNFSNILIKNLFLITDLLVQLPGRQGKLIIIPHKGRPTFKDYFNFINNNTYFDEINILANSDIYFPSEPWPILPNHNQCFALTRWDILPDGSEKFYNNSGSQDTWVFRGPIKQVKGADYTQGVAGCDNKIAWDLERAGYRVSNPSLTIKTYHLHNSGVRYYDKIEPGKRDIFRLPPPRKNVLISKL